MLVFLRKILSACLLIGLIACDSTQIKSHSLSERVSLGYQSEKIISIPFSGRWSISAPNWLSVTPSSGTGPITLRIKREPVSYPDQEILHGEIEIKGTGGRIISRLPVSAQQFLIEAKWLSSASVIQSRLSQIQADDIVLHSSPKEMPKGNESVHDEYIVTYRTAAARDQDQVLSPLGQRSAVVKLSKTELKHWQENPDIESIVPNKRFQALSTQQPMIPSDEYAPLQWYHPLVGYHSVWRDIENDGYARPVTVAVVDSGVRYDHPDLAGKLYPGLDLVTGEYSGDGDDIDLDATDPGNGTDSHGTHVSGIIAARWGRNHQICPGCSSSGIVGATYKAPIKIVPIRVLDSSNNTTAAQIAQGVLYAAGLPVTIEGKTYLNSHPADVINLSLGGPAHPTDMQVMCEAIQQVATRGKLVVAAAGNWGTKDLFYPAACEGAVAVGSVTLAAGLTPTKASYSNYYPQLNLVAPGGSGIEETYFNEQKLNGRPMPDTILSTNWDYQNNRPNYTLKSGTSQSAPQVSALAALLLSKGITQSAQDTLQRMQETATDLGTKGRDIFYGFGMINAAAALNAPNVHNQLSVLMVHNEGTLIKPVMNSGSAKAYVPQGNYQVFLGRDLNNNGLINEKNEIVDQQTVHVNENNPRVSVRLQTQ